MQQSSSIAHEDSGGKVLLLCGRKLNALDYSSVVSFKVSVRPATVAAEAIELDTFAFFSLIFSTRHSPAVGEESVRAEARVLLALAFAVLAGLPTIVGRSAAALMGLIKANAKAMAVCSGV